MSCPGCFGADLARMDPLDICDACAGSHDESGRAWWRSALNAVTAERDRYRAALEEIACLETWGGASELAPSIARDVIAGAEPQR